MALEKQLIPLPIDKGLETKLDPKQEEIGFLRQASNIVYETIKLLRKRNGYDIISDSILGASSLANTVSLSKYKKELVAFASEKLYSYSQSRLKWAEKGTVYPASTDSKDVYKGATDQTEASGIFVENFYIYTWADSAGTVRYSVQDSSDDSFIISNGLVGTGTKIRVGFIGSDIYLIYVDDSNLNFKKFSVLEPQTLSSSTTISATVNATNKLLDLDSCASRIYVAYNSNVVGSELALFYIRGDATTSSILNITGQEASRALNIVCDANFRLIVSYASASDVRYTIYPYPFTVPLLVPTTIETLANIINCTTATSATDGSYSFYYEVSGTLTQDNFIKSSTITLAGSVSSPTVFKRSVGLSARALWNGSHTLVSTVHDSEVQGSYFIFDESGKLIAKHENQRAAGIVETGVLTPVSELGDSKYFIPNEIKNRIEANSTLEATTSGVARTILDLDPENKYQNAELADALHICAGVLKMYDGNSVVEHGFHVFPEILTQINPIPITVATTTEGVTGVKEVQKLSYSAVPTAGAFTVVIGADASSSIAFNATNATIKAAIEAMISITTVTVTGSFAAGHTIQFDSPIQNLDQMVVATNTLTFAGTPEVQTISYSGVPTAGAFTVVIGSETSSSIAFNETNANIELAIEAMATITNVTVTGSFAAGHTVTFNTPVQNYAQMVIGANTLIFAGTQEVQTLSYVGTPASGSFTVSIGTETSTAIQWNDSNANITLAIQTIPSVTTVSVTGSFAAGHVVTFISPVQNFQQMVVGSNTLMTSGSIAVSVTPATTTQGVGGAVVLTFATTTQGVNPDIIITPSTTTEGIAGVVEVQTLAFTAVPIAGSFTLTIGADTTTPVNFTQGAAELEAAIEALASVTTATVTGSYSAGFIITFDTPIQNFAQATVTTNSLVAVTTLGEMSDGNYGYVAVYRWTDNTGKDHRSSPTLVNLNVILSGGTATQATVIRVPTLRITEKPDAVIELYRTEDVGTTYYKTTDDLDPVMNDPSVDYVDITDTLKDSDLIKRELLYTTGGVLENTPAPTPVLITVFNGRLVVAEENSNRVWFSKLNNVGLPVEFTDLIYRDTDPVGGAISSILAINEKLAIFEKDASFFISGDGPNNLGQQDTFTNPEIISTDIGSLRQNSLVLTPTGIMFQSRKGIWILTAQLGLSYIGSNVEVYNNSVITSAKVVGELNQIRFTTDNQIALVYNYNLNKWATFNNHGGLSAVVIENDYYYLREDGVIFVENRDSFSDASSPITMTTETGWMSFADLQGFQRVYHAMVLGAFKSSHKIRIKVAYNFIEAWVEEQLIDPLDFIDPSTYGEDSPYGAGTPYGGDGNLYQFRVDFGRQKCQSIKLLIEDAQDVVGEGFNLSSVTLRVGAKTGSNKLAASNKFGTT